MFFKRLKNQPLLLVLFVIIFLSIITFLPKEVNILGYDVKPFDLYEEVKPDSLLYYGYQNNEVKDIIGKQPVITANKNKIAPAMLPLLTLNLFNKKYSDSDKNVSLTFIPPQGRSVSIEGNKGHMSHFFQALKQQARTNKIRVAHYGDSGNEGDLVTNDIRTKLQKEFGGSGVGLLAITAQDIRFRQTMKHTFSNNWKTESVLTGNRSNYSLGLNGFASVPQGNSWVKYEATSITPSSNTVRVLYTNAKASSVRYSVNNGAEQTANLQPGKDLKEIVVNHNGTINSFELKATMAEQAQFIGVSFESTGGGVYVDNYPWRGNGGTGFRDIPMNIMKDYNRMFNYKLFIIEFGANMLEAGRIDYTWYKNQMIRIVNNLKEAFPNTSFLLVGLGDKSAKQGTRFVTHSGVPLLIKTQKEIVQETGIAFYDKFQAMGGENSMTQWVNANPPLASKDHSHFTGLGSSKIGNMLIDTILQQYRTSN